MKLKVSILCYGKKSSTSEKKILYYKNSNKVDKKTIKNKIGELKAQVKSLQKSLMGANSKKVKYINKLKQANGITCVRIEPND